MGGKFLKTIVSLVSATASVGLGYKEEGAAGAFKQGVNIGIAVGGSMAGGGFGAFGSAASGAGSAAGAIGSSTMEAGIGGIGFVGSTPGMGAGGAFSSVGSGIASGVAGNIASSAAGGIGSSTAEVGIDGVSTMGSTPGMGSGGTFSNTASGVPISSGSDFWSTAGKVAETASQYGDLAKVLMAPALAGEEGSRLPTVLPPVPPSEFIEIPTLQKQRELTPAEIDARNARELEAQKASSAERAADETRYIEALGARHTDEEEDENTRLLSPTSARERLLGIAPTYERYR